jgi:fructose-1-phosphate kinase PfkB-like protein
MRNSKIITVTLSPSLDRTLVTHYLALGYKNHTTERSRLDPGGEGVSMARAVRQLGGRQHAIVLLGKDATGFAYRALIEEEEIEVSISMVPGRTSSNTVILDTGKETETQILEESAEISGEDIQNVADILTEITKPGDFVVFTGTLPGGAPLDTYAKLTELVHEAKAHSIVVSGGQPLIEAIPSKPDLIVLRRIQAEALFNFPVREISDVFSCASKLRDMGAINVMIQSWDLSQALMVTDGDHWALELPEDIKGTTSGVWEALLAGFLVGRARSIEVEESLELGGASAIFTSQQVGQVFGSFEEVQDYAEDIDAVLYEEDSPDQKDQPKQQNQTDL